MGRYTNPASFSFFKFVIGLLKYDIIHTNKRKRHIMLEANSNFRTTIHYLIAVDDTCHTTLYM